MKIIPQFDYRQIDSLINVFVINREADTTTFRVVHTLWYVGSDNEATPNFASHKNHFEIYFIFSKNRKWYMQKIDNYSFFEQRKIKGRKVESFLTSFFSTMKKEVLTYKVDTIIKDGEMLMATKVTDHELVQTVKVINGPDTLQYKFPGSYYSNSENLKTFQFKFLKRIDNAVKQFNRKNARRENVVHSYSVPVRPLE